MRSFVFPIVVCLLIAASTAVALSADASPRRLVQRPPRRCPPMPRCKNVIVRGTDRSGCKIYVCRGASPKKFPQPLPNKKPCLIPRCPYENTGKKDRNGCPVYKCKSFTTDTTTTSLESKVEAVLSSNNIVFTKEDQGAVKTVKPDSVITIKIASNPSVGESFGKLRGDIADISEEDRNGKWQDDPHSEGETGYGGKTTWTFKLKRGINNGQVCISESFRGEEKDPFCITLKVDTASGGKKGGGQSLTLTESDRGTTKEATPGTKVALKLSMNPSVGESFGKIIGDVQVTNPGRYESDPSAEEGMTGVGGTKSYAFNVKKTTKKVCVEESFRGSPAEQPYCVHFRVTFPK